MAEQKKEVAKMNTNLSFYANEYTCLMERDFADMILYSMIILNTV